MNILSAIKRWIDVSDPRSWLAHSVVAALITLVSHALGFSLSATTWAVFVLFFVRELEQAGLALAAGVQPHWNDGLWDFVFPTLTAFILGRLI
jgi:hypothetical protein